MTLYMTKIVCTNLPETEICDKIGLLVFYHRYLKSLTCKGGNEGPEKNSTKLGTAIYLEVCKPITIRCFCACYGKKSKDI